ncbi:MAG: NAD(P)/FAD-dependent oxidoreductase [Thermoplasmata archaeon]
MRQFPIPVIIDEARELKTGSEGFTAVTDGGRNTESRTVIVASGKRPRELGVPNERKFIGRGLSYCATCDGPLHADQDIAICGGGNSAVQAAIEMGQIASKVYIVSRRPWRADSILMDKAEQVRTLEKRIGYDVVEILGETKVEGLRIRERASGREEVLSIRGVFAEIGLRPNTDFLRGIVELNEWGEAVVNCDREINVPGLFAAGDVTQVHEKQIIVTAGEGAKAALSAHEYLLRR